MGLIDVLKLANDIEGTFVEVGFGKGYTSRRAFDNMNDGTITKRESWLIDSFKGTDKQTDEDRIHNPEIEEGYDPGRLQVAMDFRYALTFPNEKVHVVQSFISDKLVNKYTGGPIACLHIDVPTYSGVLTALEALHPKLNLNAVTYIGGYEYSLGIQKAVNTYIENNNYRYQLITSEYGTHLLNKVAPVFYDSIKTDKSTIKPERVRTKKDVKVTPFEDRYTKVQPTSFKPKKDIKNGLNVLGNKVTK